MIASTRSYLGLLSRLFSLTRDLSVEKHFSGRLRSTRLTMYGSSFTLPATPRQTATPAVVRASWRAARHPRRTTAATDGARILSRPQATRAAPTDAIPGASTPRISRCPGEGGTSSSVARIRGRSSRFRLGR